jgi:hypothetical protein
MFSNTKSDLLRHERRHVENHRERYMRDDKTKRYRSRNNMAMKTPMHIIIAVSLMAGILGCRPESPPRDADSWEHLVAACKELVTDGERLDKEIWARENHLLPPAISKLSPQYVQIWRREGADVVDIQISGGFFHFGYLVVCHRNDPSFTPRKGRKWRIREVATDVFEYKE